MGRCCLKKLFGLLVSFLLSGCASAPPGTLLNPRCENAVWRPVPGYYSPSVCQDSSCPAICEAHRQIISMSPALKAGLIDGGTGSASGADLREIPAYSQGTLGSNCDSDQSDSGVCP